MDSKKKILGAVRWLILDHAYNGALALTTSSGTRLGSGTDDVRHRVTQLVTLASSTSNGVMTACGSTITKRGPTISGIRTTSSSSLSETVFFSVISLVTVFLFYIIKTPLPATKHLTHFVELSSDLFALFVRNKLAFPGNRYKKFQRVEH